MLGPLYVLVFINDFDKELINLILQFADDAKLFDKVESAEDLDIMHKDLELLCKWSQTWGLDFNVDKCKVIHFGRDNPNTAYTINNKAIKVVEVEKHLGVTVNEVLKVACQCCLQLLKLQTEL